MYSNNPDCYKKADETLDDQNPTSSFEFVNGKLEINDLEKTQKELGKAVSSVII